MHRSCLHGLCLCRLPEDDKKNETLDDIQPVACANHLLGCLPVVSGKRFAQEVKALITGHVYYGQGLLQYLFLSVRPLLTSSPSS